MSKAPAAAADVPAEPEGFSAALAAARYRASRLLAVRAHALESLFASGSIETQVEAVTSLRGRMRWDDVHGATFSVSVRLSPPPPDEGEESPLLLEVERVVVYSHLPEDASNEVLLRLADTLALSHAWPLLRQDVIDLTSRLGLPPISLPQPEQQVAAKKKGD